jgi:hypothetical protein
MVAVSADAELEIIILYGIYRLGPWVDNRRLLNYIIENDFPRPAPGETDLQTYRKTLRRDVSSAHKRLIQKKQSLNKGAGIWELTDPAKERLLEVARKVAENPRAATGDYSEGFLQQLFSLDAGSPARQRPGLDAQPVRA